MADPTNREIQVPDPERTLPLSAPLLLAAPPLVLAAGTLTGLGLLRGVPLGPAALVALVMTVVPSLGVARLLSRRFTLSCWLWCVLLLVGLPLYFPGEREEATRVGLGNLSAFLGSETSRAMGAAGAWTVALLGSDPTPAVPLPPEPSLPPVPTPVPTPTVRVPLSIDGLEPVASWPGGLDEGVELPYEGDSSSLRIQVEIDGPVTGEEFTMIFDTGATFTTLDYASLSAIGVRVEADAPRVTLLTANGTIEASLVLVDAVWLGGAPVEWVTVAVCDSCTNYPAVGLLGLNVSQRFQVSLDHDRQSISLRPRASRDNRTLDIRNWLRIRSEITENWDASVELRVTGMNDSHHEIQHVAIDLQCKNSRFEIDLDSIPADGESTTRLELPRGTDCREQSFEVTQALWEFDRF